MDLIAEALSTGFAQACSWPAVGFLLVGIVVGVVVGLLPGLGGPAMLAMLLPFTWSLSPLSTFALLMGALSVTATTGDLTSILLGVPGESTSAAVVVDGHALARRGEAGRAMGAALGASLLGALFGGLVLLLVIPVARPLMLSIGSPELLMLSVVGITFLAPLVGRSSLKGLIAAGLGLALATVGLDPIAATPRFTFDWLFLWDGIGILPVALGLFAVPEAVLLLSSADAPRPVAAATVDGVFDGLRDVRRHWRLVLRCSAIGSYVGLLPGLGASVAQWVAYAHAVSGRRAGRSAGDGIIEGVLGPSAANNATIGGALVPTLVFGIPGGVMAAILLSALVTKGVVPGEAILLPDAQGGSLSLVFSLVLFLIMANIIVVGTLVWVLAPLSRLASLRGSLLLPGVLLLTILGAFMEKSAVGDLWVVAAFGALGWAMARLGWPRPPLLLGLVLGSLVENRLWLSLDVYGWSWWSRPGVLIIGAIALAIVGHAVVRTSRDRSGWSAAGLAAPGRADVVPRRSAGDIGLVAVITLVSAAALVASREYGARPAMFPRVVLGTVLVFGLSQLWIELRPANRRGLADDRGVRRDPPVAFTAPLWVAGFMLAVALAGFTIGGPLATVAYLRLGARERWRTSLVQASVVAVFAEVVLRRVFALSLPEGVLRVF